MYVALAIHCFRNGLAFAHLHCRFLTQFINCQDTIINFVNCYKLHFVVILSKQNRRCTLLIVKIPRSSARAERARANFWRRAGARSALGARADALERARAERARA